MNRALINLTMWVLRAIQTGPDTFITDKKESKNKIKGFETIACQGATLSLMKTWLVYQHSDKSPTLHNMNYLYHT